MKEFLLALFDLLMNIVTLGYWEKEQGSRTVHTSNFISDEDLERLR